MLDLVKTYQPFTPMSHRDRISPNNINTYHKNCMGDSKENY